MKFEVTILGCGSATPTLVRNPTSQVVNVMGRHILLDCGEGTQIQLRKSKISFQKIDHIFISHLHGDHYLGLVGLVSSFHLLGRTKELNIYAPKGLKEIVVSQLNASDTYLNYYINFIELESKKSELIFEDKIIEVSTIPLKHRIYCNGFLIKEKQRERKLSKDLIEEYKIPVEVMPKLKRGEDWIKEDGTVIRNEEVTINPLKIRSYAFCTDTKYTESILPLIKDVSLLYHESTFLSDMQDRAKKTCHSTAADAANIAKMANVKKLILGHYSARYSSIKDLEREAQKIFPNTIAIDDGDIISI